MIDVRSTAADPLPAHFESYLGKTYKCAVVKITLVGF